MSTINRLSSVDALQPGDLIPVWDGSNGDTRKASLTTLLAFIESNFADPDYSTRIVAPAVDYFTVDIGATGDSIWMIVNPTLNFTNGAVTLPPASSAVNNQEITMVFTASVSTFVITSAGATVIGTNYRSTVTTLSACGTTRRSRPGTTLAQPGQGLAACLKLFARTLLATARRPRSC
jgi:hypothetical protein